MFQYRVQFINNKSYWYLAEQECLIGDLVYVNGSMQGILGRVVNTGTQNLYNAQYIKEIVGHVEPENSDDLNNLWSTLTAEEKERVCQKLNLSKQDSKKKDKVYAALSNEWTQWCFDGVEWPEFLNYIRAAAKGEEVSEFIKKRKKTAAFRVGNEFDFGTFRQGISNVERKLKWYIIKINKNQITLLCKNAIRSMGYNTDKLKVTWETCSLRKYLNGEFYDKAFSDEEKDAIINMPLEPALNNGKSLIQCRRTRDRVFLLDAETAGNLPKNIIRCYPTTRAVSENSLFISRNLDADNYIYWWLRNPGKTNLTASAMSGWGITTKSVDERYQGVRPAIVVNLNSSLFGGHFEEIEIPAVFTDEEQEAAKQAERKEYQAAHQGELDQMTQTIRTGYTDRMAASMEEIESTYPEWIQTIRKLETDCFDTNTKTPKEYFINQGILFDPEQADIPEITAFLIDRLAGTEKCVNLNELRNLHPELEKVIKRLMSKCTRDYRIDVEDYLRNTGVLMNTADREFVSNAKKEEEAHKKEEIAVQKKKEREKHLSREVEKIAVTDVKLQKQIERLFENLEKYYPEHAVFSLDAISKASREKATSLAKEIGYKNYDDMLNAYGWRLINADEVHEIRPEVIYKPGNEPEILKTRIANTVSSLNTFYPDHVIKTGLQASHKSLASTIGALCLWLGYENTNEFLKAYGFTYLSGNEANGRPRTVDPEAIIRSLKEKTKGHPSVNLDELKADNPELAGKIKTLATNSKEYFGMSLAKYLRNEGILEGRRSEKTDDDVKNSTSEIETSNVSGGEERIIQLAAESGLLPVKAGKLIDSSIPAVRELLLRYKDKIVHETKSEGSASINEAPILKAADNLSDSERKYISAIQTLITRQGNVKAVDVANYLGYSKPSVSVALKKLKEKERIKVDSSGFITIEGRSESGKSVEDYLQSTEDYREERKKFIEEYTHCLETVGKEPSEIWTDEDWKLILIFDKEAWQTGIGPIGDDMRIVDDILTEFFGARKVVGKINYNPYYKEYTYKTIPEDKKLGGDRK